MGWDPVRELKSLRERMENLFAEVESGSLSRYLSPQYNENVSPSLLEPTSTPFLDIRDEEKEITVTIDLPGVKKEDIDVRVDDNKLTVIAERSDEKTEEREGYIKKERGSGRLERMVKLPYAVKEGKAKATFLNGVLEIKLPKVKVRKKKGKKIEIN